MYCVYEFRSYVGSVLHGEVSVKVCIVIGLYPVFRQVTGEVVDVECLQ